MRLIGLLFCILPLLSFGQDVISLNIGAGTFNKYLHVPYPEDVNAKNKTLIGIDASYLLEVQESWYIYFGTGLWRKAQVIDVRYTDNDGFSNIYSANHRLNYLSFSLGVNKSLIVNKAQKFNVLLGFSLQTIISEKMYIPDIDEDWVIEIHGENQKMGSGFLCLSYSFMSKSKFTYSPFIRADYYFKKRLDNQINSSFLLGVSFGYTLE